MRKGLTRDPFGYNKGCSNCRVLGIGIQSFAFPPILTPLTGMYIDQPLNIEVMQRNCIDGENLCEIRNKRHCQLAIFIIHHFAFIVGSTRGSPIGIRQSLVIASAHFKVNPPALTIHV